MRIGLGLVAALGVIGGNGALSTPQKKSNEPAEGKKIAPTFNGGNVDESGRLRFTRADMLLFPPNSEAHKFLKIGNNDTTPAECAPHPEPKTEQVVNGSLKAENRTWSCKLAHGPN